MKPSRWRSLRAILFRNCETPSVKTGEPLELGQHLGQGTELRRGQQRCRPCTILTIANGWWTGFWKNKKDALSTSPQAGFLERSESLWALWATPSSELHRETDRVLRLQLGRFAGSAFWPP